MKKSQLRAFARRDWQAIALAKAAYWAKAKKVLGAEQAIRVGEDLRRHALLLHPDWPTAEDRRQDLATHSRIAASLRRVVSKNAR